MRHLAAGAMLSSVVAIGAVLVTFAGVPFWPVAAWVIVAGGIVGWYWRSPGADI